VQDRATVEDDDDDWRLVGTLTAAGDRHGLHALVERLQDPRVLADVRAAVSDRVVITHDGSRLFAYAPTRAAIERARATIEAVLARDGMSAALMLSRYAHDRDEWVDPDAAPAAPPGVDSGPRTRTFVATAGRMALEDFEQSMRTWAEELGLRCETHEHPHLLSSQVAFTVTGPSRKLDEFFSGMRAEGRAAIRTELAVMASPL
jgi:hypothetical protein